MKFCRTADGQISQSEILKFIEKARAAAGRFHEISLNFRSARAAIKFYKFKAKFKRIMDESIIDQRR